MDDEVPNELYYLADEFPPRSLRRYQLKAILQQYSIDVPNSLKKADLVQLFQTHVLSRKDQLIAEYRAKQTGQTEPELPARRSTVEKENVNESRDKDHFFVPAKSSTFTVKEMSPEAAHRAIDEPPAPPKAPTPEHIPVYAEEEDDDEYVFSGSDLEYSDDEYSDDEPVDKSEVAWLIQDTEQAKMTKKERVLATANQYWATAQMVFRGTYILLFLLAAAAAITIVVARGRNGYCDTTTTEEQASLSPLDKLASLSSSCIPCPDHGVCADGALLCPGLYKRRRPLYNAFGLLPVADECIQDSAIGRAVARTEKRIKYILARQQGQHMCDYVGRFGSAEGLSMIHIKREDIKQAVLERYLAESKLSPNMLEQVLHSAFASLASDPKVHYWEIDGEPYFGTERASFTMWCSVKMFFAQASPQFRKIVVALTAGIPTLSFAWYNYMWHSKIKRHTDAKVAQVIAMLKEQLEKHLSDPENIERGFPVSQIRVKLTDVHMPGSVDEWIRIAQGVQRHPHVRRAFREVAGEPCEYWELAH
ncbi:Man1-Src1p-C-terminal domain-containing protein [Fennellomyces sp. T-0311]|nr:Man1-Src1p-C-terminal domain-containing protein [Fennellomyces sp. T-0311]